MDDGHGKADRKRRDDAFYADRLSGLREVCQSLPEASHNTASPLISDVQYQRGYDRIGDGVEHAVRKGRARTCVRAMQS